MQSEAGSLKGKRGLFLLEKTRYIIRVHRRGEMITARGLRRIGRSWRMQLRLSKRRGGKTQKRPVVESAAHALAVVAVLTANALRSLRPTLTNFKSLNPENPLKVETEKIGGFLCEVLGKERRRRFDEQAANPEH